VIRIFTFLFGIFVFMSQLPIVSAKEVLLEGGTTVFVRSMETIDADEAQTGSIVNFQIVRSVKRGETTVIKAGELIRAKVASKKNNFIFGIPGKITLDGFETKAVDGTAVYLQPKIAYDGDDRYAVSLIGGLFVGLPFFIKGEDGIIKGGNEYTLYTVDAVKVNVTE
jgi:hypothetical protein